MQKTLHRIINSGLLAATSMLALTLAEPSIPASPDWLMSGPVLASTKADLSASEIYQQSIKSVVTIYTLDQNYEITGNFGSGFVADADGLIITNAHVVNSGITSALVVFSDGSRSVAEVVALDRYGKDLAALQLIGEYNRPALSLANQGMPTIGESVYAIGSPRGIANTMTSGIVGNITPDQSEILHNAAINGGNSGGPLLNAQGQVIGINTWIYRASVETVSGEVIGGVDGYSGMSFAIATIHIAAFITDVETGMALSPTQPAQQIAHH